jgi:hypothetical protein
VPELHISMTKELEISSLLVAQLNLLFQKLRTLISSTTGVVRSFDSYQCKSSRNILETVPLWTEVPAVQLPVQFAVIAQTEALTRVYIVDIILSLAFSSI